jgi:hypothetical protein
MLVYWTLVVRSSDRTLSRRRSDYKVTEVRNKSKTLTDPEVVVLSSAPPIRHVLLISRFD